MKFLAEQFTPTKWASAENKAKLANWFMKFVRADMPQKMFSQAMYKRLMSMFGFSAHYDREGFWQMKFSTSARKLKFFKDVALQIHYGDPAWTWNDVEKVLAKWVIANDLINIYELRAGEEELILERAQYERLKAKFG